MSFQLNRIRLLALPIGQMTIRNLGVHCIVCTKLHQFTPEEFFRSPFVKSYLHEHWTTLVIDGCCTTKMICKPCAAHHLRTVIYNIAVTDEQRYHRTLLN